MLHHLSERHRHKTAAVHFLLAALLVGCAVLVFHWPAGWRAVGTVAATSVAVHVGLALAGAGALFAAVRSHADGHRHEDVRPGATLHSPRFYD